MRVGFAVSRNISHAAIRNQIKRKMREAFRAHQYLFFGEKETPVGSLELVIVYTRARDEKLKRSESQELAGAISKVLSMVREQGRGS